MAAHRLSAIRTEALGALLVKPAFQHLSPDPGAALAGSDVRAIVKLVGEVITPRHDLSELSADS